MSISLAALEFAATYETSPEIAQVIVETYPASSDVQSMVWEEPLAWERAEILSRAWRKAPSGKVVLDWHGPVLRPNAGGW